MTVPGLQTPIVNRSAHVAPHSSAAKGGYALSGPSDLPDPATHAYRKDLADISLAGRVISSHYAEPLLRHLTADAELHHDPSGGSEVIATLLCGDAMRILDNSRGWAWGYGPDGQVGYVASDRIGA
jgi:hypothetical protein